MFLQYFVQGCYLPVVSVYLEKSLHFSKLELGYFGAALAVGPMLVSFVLGQVVDRGISTQWVLAFCHFCGGVLMLALYFQTAFLPIIILGTLYSILYIPTLMLTNSLSFYHLKNSPKEFPIVRLFGTIGFIVPAWWIEMGFLAGLEGTELDNARKIVFLLAGIFGLVMGGYCLTLPATPPHTSASAKFAPGVVLSMLRRRDFVILIVVGILVAICHKFFFVLNSPYLRWVLDSEGIPAAVEQRISSLGQVSEVLVFVFLAYGLSRLGFRWTFLIGVTAYLLRCLIFALVAANYSASAGEDQNGLGLLLVCLGQLMHGYCFVCFWAAAFIYLEKITEPSARGSMQTFFGTLVFGFGMFIGGFISGGIGDALTVGSGDNAVSDWPTIWLAGGSFALVGMLVLWICFPTEPPKEALAETGPKTPAAQPEPTTEAETGIQPGPDGSIRR